MASFLRPFCTHSLPEKRLWNSILHRKARPNVLHPSPCVTAFRSMHSLGQLHPAMISRKCVKSNITPSSFKRLRLNSNAIHRPISRRYYTDHSDKVPQSPEEAWRVIVDLWRSDPRLRWIFYTLLASGVFYVYHLEPVPETGRIRFIFVSEDTEKELQDDQYEELLEEFRDRVLPSNHPITQQVRNVVSTILEANELGVLSSSSPTGSAHKRPAADQMDIWDPDAKRTDIDYSAEGKTVGDGSIEGKQRKWNLMVVNDDKTVNAMVVNGNIIVFTGILPVAGDIDGLAAVLSHEIAHVVARHLSERLSQLSFFKVLFFVLSVFGIDTGFGPALVNFLYHLPNSRVQELEADKIGLKLAARACYDPKGAVAMQMRLAHLEKRGGRQINLEFLQTHPSGDKRIQRLTRDLPEAYTVRAGSSTCAELEDDFDLFRTMSDSIRYEQQRELKEETVDPKPQPG